MGKVGGEDGTNGASNTPTPQAPPPPANGGVNETSPIQAPTKSSLKPAKGYHTKPNGKKVNFPSAPEAKPSASPTELDTKTKHVQAVVSKAREEISKKAEHAQAVVDKGRGKTNSSSPSKQDGVAARLGKEKDKVVIDYFLMDLISGQHHTHTPPPARTPLPATPEQPPTPEGESSFAADADGKQPAGCQLMRSR